MKDLLPDGTYFGLNRTKDGWVVTKLEIVKGKVVLFYSWPPDMRGIANERMELEVAKYIGGQQ